MNISRQRLASQRLSTLPFATPAEAVAWLGAVQSQELPSAKWGLAQRTQGATDAIVEQALAEGAILRTHVLCPTWHFVAPADIRWMLALTAPRVHARNAYYYSQCGLDGATLARCHALLAKALEGGGQLTRPELAARLNDAGLAADQHTFRMAYILMHAELEGLICSGAPRGKQQTYALLDERVPPVHPLDRDEALATLALRYVQSHGPATLKDFVWWSGLTSADATAALEMNRGLVQETIDGQRCWLAPAPAAPAPDAPAAWLLSIYDEFLISYADRGAVGQRAGNAHVDILANLRSNSLIVVDGQLVGTWRRTLKAKSVLVEAHPFVPLDPGEIAAVEDAAARLGAFLGRSATLVWQ